MNLNKDLNKDKSKSLLIFDKLKFLISDKSNRLYGILGSAPFIDAIYQYASKEKINIIEITALSLFSALAIYTSYKQKKETELSHAEEVKQLLQEIEEAKLLTERFVQNISHEIRTPMNGIRGFSKMLNSRIDLYIQKGDNISVKNISDTIALSAKRLLELMDDCIDISHIEAKCINIHYEILNIKELIKAVSNLDNHKYLKVIDIDGNSDIKIQIDPSIENIPDYLIGSNKITRILTHIIGNAIKFTKGINDGCINISCKMEEQETGVLLHIYVKDNGIGIEKSEINKIFKNFQQSKKNEPNAYGGTGLGLPISKGFANAMGGDIMAHSDGLGKGTTFTFSCFFKYPSLQEILNIISKNGSFKGISKDLDVMRKLSSQDIFNFINDAQDTEFGKLKEEIKKHKYSTT